MTDETAKQAQQTVLSERLAVLRKNKAFIIGASILGFWVFSAIFGKLIARYDQDFMDYEFINSAPSGKYWFGTDSNGRDVYSRVIVGSRIIIVISFLATLLGAFLGASLGLAAGYLKGKFDMVLMRILEAISAIPVIIIALFAVAAIGRSSSIITILIIGLIFTPNVARTVRAAVLGESELEYVAAAKLRTEKTAHILFREVLPNVLPTLMVQHKFRNAGQACLAPTRFFVDKRIYGDFVEAFGVASSALRVGSGLEAVNANGPGSQCAPPIGSERA